MVGAKRLRDQKKSIDLKMDKIEMNGQSTQKRSRRCK